MMRSAKRPWFALALTAIFSMVLLADRAWATCASTVFSSTLNSGSTYQLNLPKFTGTSPMPATKSYSPGDHHYSATTITSGGDADSSSPTARIFINGDLRLNGGDPNFGFAINEPNLLIIVNGDIHINQDTNGEGFLYATGNIYLNHSQFDLDGRVAAQGTISGPETGKVDDRSPSGLDMGDLCDPVEVREFNISVPAADTSCAAAVTITALKGGGDTFTDYTGTITLSTSSGLGDWSKTSANGTLTNGTADDGSATYTFTGSDNGVVTLSLTDFHNDTPTVTVNDSSAGVSKTSSSITFDCALDNFQISAPATASACGSASITIRAVGSTGDPLTTYEGTVNLTTSSGHGDWSKSSASGTLTNGTADDGAASYTFVLADNGEITLDLTNRHADVTSVTVNDSDEGVSEISSNITFQDNGIEINDVTGRNWDVIAGRDHSFQVEYTVLQPDTTECLTATEFDGTVTLKIWRALTGSNPSGASAPTITNGVDTYTLSSSSGSPTSLDVSIASGVGNFTLGTTDVGDFDLNVTDDSSGFAVDGGGSPITLSGTDSRGSSITVRPFGLYVNIIDNDWHADWISLGLTAADAEGPAFISAGESFTVEVTGVRYDSGDDSNNDGVPDGFDDADPQTLADLSDNATTASFANEGADISYSHTLIEPSAGSSGSLTTVAAGSFASGSVTSTLSYDEVGIIELSAMSDSNYLSSNQQILGKSGYVGRFIPHHFGVVGNTVLLAPPWLDSDTDGINDWTCIFGYWGQPFAFDANPQLTITAYNRDNDITLNYDGVFNKYIDDSSETVGELRDNGLPLASTSTLTLPAIGVSMSQSSGGVFTQTVTGYTATPYTMVYTRPEPPTANEVPFVVDFDLVFPNDSGSNFVDSDGVCYGTDSDADSVVDTCESVEINDINGYTMYYGRLAIDGNFGSETQPLILPYRTEIWNAVGSNYGFVAFSGDSDSCSGTSGLVASQSNYQEQLGAGETTVTVNALVAGRSTLDLTAPGANNYGQTTVTLDVPSFLEYDFNGDGFVEDPSATATFKIYGGTGDNMLFLKETYR